MTVIIGTRDTSSEFARDFKTSLGVQNSSLTEQQSFVIDSFSRSVMNAIKNYIGYDFDFKQDQVAFLPSIQCRTEDNFLILPTLAVRRITSVHVDENGRFGQNPDGFSGSSLEIGKDCFFEAVGASSAVSGMLIKTDGTWPVAPGSVKVVYDNGYTAEELNGTSENGVDASAIRAAFLFTMKNLYSQVVSSKSLNGSDLPAPVASERAGDYSVSFNADAVARVQSGKISLTAQAIGYLEPFVSYHRLGL